MWNFRLILVSVGSLVLLAGCGETGGGNLTPPTVQNTSISTPTPVQATPISAQVIMASQQYLGAVTPLNVLESQFTADVLLGASGSCKCPAGQFDVSAAITLIPKVQRALDNLTDALNKIGVELPTTNSDVNRLKTEISNLFGDYASVIQDSQFSTAFAVTEDIKALGDAHKVQAYYILKLRTDLGLPAPVGLGF